jgi:hypothetical protein
MENKDESEERLDRLENEEFERTGVFSTSFKINIKITEEDMVKQLVKDSEGQTTDPNTIYRPSEN